MVDVVLSFTSIIEKNRLDTKLLPPLTLDFVRPLDDSKDDFEDIPPQDAESAFKRYNNPNIIKEYYTVTNLTSIEERDVLIRNYNEYRQLL